ncbi:hypothetical protein BDW22DRAFT_886151 [Trametopsis cervina]|nr:hypothetical protein BDW22DRAFT_886151 [Trametopsis cervina]
MIEPLRQCQAPTDGRDRRANTVWARGCKSCVWAVPSLYPFATLRTRYTATAQTASRWTGDNRDYCTYPPRHWPIYSTVRRNCPLPKSDKCIRAPLSLIGTLHSGVSWVFLDRARPGILPMTCPRRPAGRGMRALCERDTGSQGSHGRHYCKALPYGKLPGVSFS